MSTVAVHAPVLRWAQRRSGHDDHAMRSRFRKWDRWLNSVDEPSLAQVEEIARFTHVPVGALFLPTPPAEQLPIPDFRPGRGPTMAASDNLLDTIFLNQRRQGWYEDYLARLGAVEPLSFVGSARAASIDDTAAMITQALDYGLERRVRLRSINDARRWLVDHFEALGGLIVISSMVENNTHRMLDLTEFRGFSLPSATAPLVFVNGVDTKRGQVFSLLHEFAHVWLGQTGISAGGEPLRNRTNSVERWCDAVAAEIAVPRADLRERHRGNVDFTDDDARAGELDRLGNYYRCSTLVVLIKLRELALIAPHDFDVAYEHEVLRLVNLIDTAPKSSGGDFYRNQFFKIGPTLSRAIIRDAAQGTTPMTEALRLMSFTRTSTFDRYAREIGEG